MSTDLIAAVIRLRRSLTRAAASFASTTGVGPRQVGVLRELRHTGPLSQVELARSTATDPAGLMRAIDALEARGWVRRASSDHDRRRKLVSLTPHGERAFRAIDAAYAPLRQLADGALTDAERRQFVALTEKLAAALEAIGHAAPPPRETTPVRTRAAGRRPESR